MNTPDNNSVFRAVLDARSILNEHEVAFGSCDPARAVERLRVVLDRDELIHALDRMNRKPVARLERGKATGGAATLGATTNACRGEIPLGTTVEFESADG